MKHVARIAALLLAGHIVATPAHAGVVDSPLPAPFTQHVFTAPGVRTDQLLAPFFSCSNLDAVPVTVGVELFGWAGGGPYNDAAATSLSIAPGATWTFRTSFGVWFSASSDLGGAGMGSGSARILATSKKIACTAFIADNTSVPPASAWQLTIIKQKKQKGD